MWFSYSPIEIISYGVMVVLVIKAIAHRSHAYAVAKSYAPIVRELREIGASMGRAHTPLCALDRAHGALLGTALDGIVKNCRADTPPKLIDLWVADGVRAEIGPLYRACERNHSNGPSWGLVFTVVGASLALHSAGATEGGAAFHTEMIGGVSLALLSTGIGMVVAIVEQNTMSKLLTPLAQDLRASCTQIMVLAARPHPLVASLREVSHV